MSWPSSSPRCRYGSTGMAAEIRYFIASGADAVIRVESDSDGPRFSDATSADLDRESCDGRWVESPESDPTKLARVF